MPKEEKECAHFEIERSRSSSRWECKKMTPYQQDAFEQFLSVDVDETTGSVAGHLQMPPPVGLAHPAEVRQENVPKGSTEHRANETGGV